MREWIVAGNWKMNNTVKDAVALASAIKDGSKDIKGGTIIVAPVFTTLVSVAEAIKGSGIRLAAQNVFYEEKGAFTGEIAPAMLLDVGCTYVIIGHSERRKYFHETDEGVNAKTKKALASGLRPIVCVGETEEEREKGITEFVVGTQIRKGLYTIENLKNIVIAYEPVWAIGTGKNATPAEAQEVHAFIRSLLRKSYGEEAAGVQILYGGSVTKDNIGELISMEDIDGALVGGASLKSDSFLSIIKAVANR